MEATCLRYSACESRALRSHSLVKHMIANSETSWLQFRHMECTQTCFHESDDWNLPHREASLLDYMLIPESTGPSSGLGCPISFSLWPVSQLDSAVPFLMGSRAHHPSHGLRERCWKISMHDEPFCALNITELLMCSSLKYNVS